MSSRVIAARECARPKRRLPPRPLAVRSSGRVRPPPPGGALTPPDRRGIALDLRIDGLAEPEALVTQLGDVFGFQLVAGSIYAAHSLEKTEGQQRVDRGRRGHGDANVSIGASGQKPASINLVRVRRSPDWA